MRLILFFTVLDIRYVVNCLFYKLQGLKEGKMDKFIANGKYSHQKFNSSRLNLCYLWKREKDTKTCPAWVVY